MYLKKLFQLLIKSKMKSLEVKFREWIWFFQQQLQPPAQQHPLSSQVPTWLILRLLRTQSNFCIIQFETSSMLYSFDSHCSCKSFGSLSYSSWSLSQSMFVTFKTGNSFSFMLTSFLCHALLAALIALTLAVFHIIEMQSNKKKCRDKLKICVYTCPSILGI